MEQDMVGTQNTTSETNSYMNEMTTPVKPEAPVEPMVTQEPTMAPAKPEGKKGQWMLLLLILCLIVACGGVGFGVWTIVDKDAQVARLNSQIATLQSQNAELIEKIEGHGAAKMWGSTEVEDGVFYVKDEEGDVIVQSNIDTVTVNEIISCDASDDDTVLKCTVNTDKGEGWFLYDVYGDSLSSSFDEEELGPESETSPETE